MIVHIITKGKVHPLRTHIIEIFHVTQADRCMTAKARARVHARTTTTDLISKGYILIPWKERKILLHTMLNSWWILQATFQWKILADSHTLNRPSTRNSGATSGLQCVISMLKDKASHITFEYHSCHSITRNLFTAFEWSIGLLGINMKKPVQRSHKPPQ
jgi:hypothetical protein